MRVLLVEDDELLGEGLQRALIREKLEVNWLRDGEAASADICNPVYDTVILDLGLPRVSGNEVLRRARENGCDVPVLILSAQNETDERVRALDSGADDYMTKPFELSELMARLRALFRRSRGKSDEVVRYGDIEINLGSQTASKDGHYVELSRREYVLLLELLTNVGRILTKKQLEEKIYGDAGDIGSNTIEVYIHHLRKKFGNDTITTVRGMGYLAPVLD